MNRGQWVYLVDDDEAIRKSTSFMLQTAGFMVRTFCSGMEFLDECNKLEPGCIVIDLGMPGIDGGQVLATLRQRQIALPVIVITGQGEVGLALRAMKAGACNFFEKPFERAPFIDAVEDAFLQLADSGHARHRRETAQARLLQLSTEERQVLRSLIDDTPARTIALDLGMSQHIVEVLRARLMQKLETANLSETLRIALVAGMGDD
jgi:two-component system response regulator FixJ